MGNYDVSKWKLKSNSEVIGQVKRCIELTEPRSVVNKALDGSVYIQTIGRPSRKLQIDIGMTQEEQRRFVVYYGAGALFELQYKDNFYIGFIVDEPQIEAVKAGEYYNMNTIFLIEGSV